MEMIIGKYRLIQYNDGYAIEDTTAPDDEFTILSNERMLQIIEDIYTDYLE